MDRAIITKGSDQEHNEHHPNRSRHRSLVVDADRFGLKAHRRIFFRMPAATNQADVVMHDLHAFSSDAAKGLLVTFDPTCAVYGATPFPKTNVSQTCRKIEMHDTFSGTEDPPSEQEVRRFNLEFYRAYAAFFSRDVIYRRGVRRSVLDGPDLANKIAVRADRAYRRVAQFRLFVRTNGIGSVRKHPFWGRWLDWEISEQWIKHYRAMPRMLTYDQINWLRLGACRSDGMLFPLVGDQIPPVERQLLNRLVKDKKVVPFFTTPGVGVWKTDPVLGELTLRVTPKGEGGGDSDLQLLVVRGYLEKIETQDPNLRWRTEENVMYTLRLTEKGRDHIDKLVSGRLESVEERQDAGKEMSDGAPSSEDQLDLNRVRRLSVEEKVEAAKACLNMPDLHAMAYVMYRSESGPDYTLKQVGDACGKGTNTIHCWVKKWDARFTDPEILMGLSRYIERNRKR